MNNQTIHELDEVIQLDPKDATAYEHRGDAYRRKGEYDRSIIDYNKAIELDPKKAEAYHNRGIAYMYKDDYDKAIKDFDKAIALDPEYAEAYCSRGIAYRFKGDYPRAIEDFDKAISLDHKKARAYSSRGITYHYYIGDHDKAIIDYDKAISLDPEDATYYINRGYAYDNKEEYAKAIEDYDNAVRLCPYRTDMIDRKFAGYVRNDKNSGRSEVDKIIPRLHTTVEDYCRSGNRAAAAYYFGVLWLHKNDSIIPWRAFNDALKLSYKPEINVERHLKNLIEAEPILEKDVDAYYYKVRGK